MEYATMLFGKSEFENPAELKGMRVPGTVQTYLTWEEAKKWVDWRNENLDRTNKMKKMNWQIAEVKNNKFTGQ